MIRALAILAASACAGPPRDLPFAARLEFDTLTNAQAISAEIERQASDLNERCGRELARLESEADTVFRFVPYGWYKRRAIGVSFSVGYGDGSDVVFVASDGLPPEESTTGELSPCEAGRLFLFYVGTFNGLRPQYTDPTRITYAHPDCPGQIADPIGDLIDSLGVCQ